MDHDKLKILTSVVPGRRKRKWASSCWVQVQARYTPGAASTRGTWVVRHGFLSWNGGDYDDQVGLICREMFDSSDLDSLMDDNWNDGKERC